MPILSDFECPECGEIFEQICNADDQFGICLTCGCEAKRIISLGRVYCSNQDAPWLRSVLDVVDKDDNRPHVRNFRENPTRENYKAWMKGEGIKPLDYTDHGAPPVARKPEPVDHGKFVDFMMQKLQESRRLEVR